MTGVFLYRFYIIIILILLSFNFVNAQSVMVYRTGKKKVRLNWKTQVKTRWKFNQEKVPVFTYIVNINIPSRVRKAKSKRSNKIKISAKKIQIHMTSLTDRVQILTQKNKIGLYLKIKDYKNDLDSKLCDDRKLLLQKVVDSQKLPFRVSMTCYQRNKEEFLVVSVPKEVRWASTTIPENRGKGENWKEYRIEDLPSGDGEVRGIFTFRYKKKNYKIQLRSKPDPEVLVSEKARKTTFYAGIGLINLNIKSEISDLSDSPYLFIAGVEKELDFLKISAGLNIIAAFATESTDILGEKPPEFFEGRAHIGRFFGLSESFKFMPMILGIFQKSSDPNVLLTIKHNQLGLGGAFNWQITSSFDFRYDIWISGFLASTPTSQLGMQANITYDFTQSFGLGFNFSNQALSTESLMGVKNELAETHYGLYIRFQ